jgi:hypothetical protein
LVLQELTAVLVPLDPRQLRNHNISWKRGNKIGHDQRIPHLLVGRHLGMRSKQLCPVEYLQRPAVPILFLVVLQVLQLMLQLTGLQELA